MPMTSNKMAITSQGETSQDQQSPNITETGKKHPVSEIGPGDNPMHICCTSDPHEDNNLSMDSSHQRRRNSRDPEGSEAGSVSEQSNCSRNWWIKQKSTILHAQCLPKGNSPKL